MHKKCTLCPRNCGVDRENGERGLCGQTNDIKVARAALHFWEEPCISGEEGSGTVFFSGCNLRCVYCQNRKIAEGVYGKEITVDRLAAVFLELQEKGANNINLVTPSHYVLQIIDALKIAKTKGLEIPVVYNSSAYEKVETLKLLEGLVDVYLPDFKYMDENLSEKYSRARNYPDVAKKAIKEMVRQVGNAKFNDKDMLIKGVVVRHLVLPGYVEDSKKVIKYLYETYKNDIYISILSQFTPLEGLENYPEINRKLNEEEYDEVVDYAIELGVENGFIQEGDVAKESFIPDFDGQGV
jgi:putative pyruvate formate lyase activating enzyme